MAKPAPPPAPGGGSGSGLGTGNTCSSFGETGSLFQGTAASDPFGDAHAVSRINDIDVNSVDRVNMSTYQDEATDGRLSIFSQHYQACSLPIRGGCRL